MKIYLDIDAKFGGVSEIESELWEDNTAEFFDSNLDADQKFFSMTFLNF